MTQQLDGTPQYGVPIYRHGRWERVLVVAAVNEELAEISALELLRPGEYFKSIVALDPSAKRWIK